MTVLGIQNCPLLASLTGEAGEIPTSENSQSLEDESDDEFSIVSELPYEGQDNSIPDGTVSPNPHKEVCNPTSQSNGKPILKAEARGSEKHVSFDPF